MQILRLSNTRANNLISKIDEYFGYPIKNLDGDIVASTIATKKEDNINDGKFFVVIKDVQYNGIKLNIEEYLLESLSGYLDDVVSIEEFRECIEKK